ncbi:hypothetical protein [Phycisphaera mikurensis]|uniref:hypothetical protein n=1 Tax=Phycisphaera mikurensis TaxID=547188 RepID=UPI0036F36FAF
MPPPAVLLAAALAACPASGRELFVVGATGAGGTPAVQRGGSDAFDLLDDALQARGGFGGFDGTQQRIRLDYAGVADAAVVDVSADGRTATVRLRGVGFERTFRGDDRDDLTDEIEDFFEEEGSDVYARYLRYLREQAAIGSVDGNPDAATALLATGSFSRHALPGPEALGGARSLSFQLDENRIGWVRYTGTGGYADSDGFGGVRLAGTLDGGIDFSEWVGLTGAYTFGYREVAGADLWQSGIELGLPVTLLGHRPAPLSENALSLRLTPVLQFGGAGSRDTGDLGSFVGYGLNAGGGLRIGDLTFSVGAGIVGYSGLEQTFYDHDDDEDNSGPFLSEVDRDTLDTDLSQAVASLGGGVLWRPGTRFALDAGLAYHRFLDDAAVQGWWAPTAGVSLTGERTTLRLGYEGSFADESRDLYEGHALEASFTYSF